MARRVWEGVREAGRQRRKPRGAVQAPLGLVGPPIRSAARRRTAEVRHGRTLQGECTEVPWETFLSQDLLK